VRGAIEFARQVSPAGSRNLIAPHESYLSVLQLIIRPARDILHAHNLKGFHELRAAFACERYEQITQHRAPVNSGQCYQVDKNLDSEARRQISHELGHCRINVVSAYIGGRR
ncbi:integrase, partial [Pseudomonas sp. yb_2]